MQENHCVLACVTVQKNCDRIIHRGRALARQAGVPLRVLHVSKSGNPLGSPDTAPILNELFSLAHECDAEMNVLCEQNVAAAIVRYAQDCGALFLVLGPDKSGTAGRVRHLLPPDSTLQMMQLDNND